MRERQGGRGCERELGQIETDIDRRLPIDNDFLIFGDHAVPESKW